MAEEPDRFKEILEEIFDSKIEIIQMIDTIDKKLEKLILARNFDKSEQPEKESNTKTKVAEEKTRRKVVKISITRCNKCQGRISWDDYETTGRPIHVDINGFVMGNGACPKWEDNHE